MKVEIVVTDAQAQELGRTSVETVSVEESENVTHVFAMEPIVIDITASGRAVRAHVLTGVHRIQLPLPAQRTVNVGNKLTLVPSGPLIVARQV